jgi:acid phosphatase type 7
MIKSAWVLLISPVFLSAQAPAPPRPSVADLPTANLLSESGPTFRIDDRQLPNPLTFIAYGDQRFTDPTNTRSANPRIREWLVSRIASEKPAAIILNGDVPLRGDAKEDYAVFVSETKPWRDAHLRVYPALGNHEFTGDPASSLQNWWENFPEMKNRRWYSVALGSRVYVIALDTNASLLPGSLQAHWLEDQIDHLSVSVDFLILTMHHPPVADIQKHIEVDHNPRPNEIALREYLSKAAQKSHAQILVSAGHIHNYERSIMDGVTYLVAGGGGAAPYFVERTPQDLYQSVLFPNFHYVKFTLERDRLHGAMYRVADPEAEKLGTELKESFDIAVKPR